MTGNITKFFRLVRTSIRTRRVYASTSEACRAFGLRLAAYELSRRDPGKIESIQLKGYADPFFVRRGTSDFLVLREIFERHAYEPITRMNLPADATILDLGANIGLATRYFCEILPRAKVIAVEPDAANIAMIEMNCASLIREGRLRILQSFIAAREGQASIDRSGGAFAFRMAGDREGQEMIPCVSVPTILRDANIASIDLLKCDIEGSEAELFAGCEAWINRAKNLFVETHEPYRLKNLYDDLTAAGKQFEVFEEHQRSKVGTCFLCEAN